MSNTLVLGRDFEHAPNTTQAYYNENSTNKDSISIDSSLMLPFNDNAFQTILVSNIFPTLSAPDIAYFFRELRRVLIPDGHLIMHFTGECNGKPLPMDSFFYFSSFSGLKKTKHIPPILTQLNVFNQIKKIHLHVFRKPVIPIRKTPLVSILMTAFRPDFFKESLASAVSQTYPNTEIIIGDDSEGDEIENIVRSFDFKNVPYRYIKNETRFHELNNMLNLFNLANGDYIKYLNDDDIIYPTCIEKMEPALSGFPTISLVSSTRHVINKDSHILNVFPLPISLDQDTILYGDLVVNLLATYANFVGEPTTTLFRKESVIHIHPHFISINQNHPEMGTPGDILIWVNLMA